MIAANLGEARADRVERVEHGHRLRVLPDERPQLVAHGVGKDTGVQVGEQIGGERGAENGVVVVERHLTSYPQFPGHDCAFNLF